MTRDGAGGDNQIHRIDLTSRSSTPLVSLGVFQNKIALGTAMTASANGRYILIAQPDGTLMLYDSSADTFTVSRKEVNPAGRRLCGIELRPVRLSATHC